MKVLVLISNVPDTTTKIRFTGDNNFDSAGVQWIINPWDELALTRAVELKEAGSIEKITAANVGSKITEATLRKALAVGADDAIRIDAEPTDGFFERHGEMTLNEAKAKLGEQISYRDLKFVQAHLEYEKKNL